jgi:hypothetical protein
MEIVLFTDCIAFIGKWGCPVYNKGFLNSVVKHDTHAVFVEDLVHRCLVTVSFNVALAVCLPYLLLLTN